MTRRLTLRLETLEDRCCPTAIDLSAATCTDAPARMESANNLKQMVIAVHSPGTDLVAADTTTEAGIQVPIKVKHNL